MLRELLTHPVYSLTRHLRKGRFLFLVHILSFTWTKIWEVSLSLFVVTGGSFLVFLGCGSSHCEEVFIYRSLSHGNEEGRENRKKYRRSDSKTPAVEGKQYANRLFRKSINSFPSWPALAAGLKATGPEKVETWSSGSLS